MEFGELLKEFTLVLNTLHRRNVCFDRFTLSQCFVLLSIPDGGIDMSTLSNNLGLDNSTMTRLVNTLEKKGLVHREKDHLDRRVFRVMLTDEGEKIAARFEGNLETLGEAVFENISFDKQEQVKESLEDVLWSLSKERLSRRA